MSTDYETVDEQTPPAGAKPEAELKGAVEDIDDEVESLRAEIERQIETIEERQAEAKELAAQIEELRAAIEARQDEIAEPLGEITARQEAITDLEEEHEGFEVALAFAAADEAAD